MAPSVFPTITSLFTETIFIFSLPMITLSTTRAVPLIFLKTYNAPPLEARTTLTGTIASIIPSLSKSAKTISSEEIEAPETAALHVCSNWVYLSYPIEISPLLNWMPHWSYPFNTCAFVSWEMFAGGFWTTALLDGGGVVDCEFCKLLVCGCSTEAGFFTNITYPKAPAKTTTKIIKTIFANPFWFIFVCSLVYNFRLVIKKFSSPKIKIWFEPMFFSGFFCGFERCGSAAFPNFRGGTSSPPQAAKCVRTIFRILHHVGNCKFEGFASLRSATNLYSILGAKTNWRFRKIWFEPMFFRNVGNSERLFSSINFAALFIEFTNSRAR